MGLFSKNDLKRINAWRGRWSGTSCPAPVIVTNVSPLYTWVQPPTYITKELVLVRRWDINFPVSNQSMYMILLSITWDNLGLISYRKMLQKHKSATLSVNLIQLKVRAKDCMHIQISFQVPTLPWSYHGCQLVTVDSFRASMEYLVAVTGTTESVSPLPRHIKSHVSDKDANKALQ